MYMKRRTPPYLFAVGASLLALALLQPSVLSAQGGREQPDSAKPLIELRFARQAPAPGFRPMTVPRSGDVVHVSDQNEFTDQDFEHVQAEMMQGGLILVAQWKPLSAERSAAIRRGEAGAGNDFLALLIDGKLISAPRLVVDPMASAAPTVDIAVYVPPEEAERIARAVAARWSGGDPLD